MTFFKLAIPKFKSNPKEKVFVTYLILYTVHKNLQLKTVLKFRYLKFYLENEPLKRITSC